jgi:hypothetical protein
MATPLFQRFPNYYLLYRAKDIISGFLAYREFFLYHKNSPPDPVEGYWIDRNIGCF